MIRTPHTEYVRLKLRSLKREPAEIGRLLVEAFDRSEHLRREKARMLDEFRREEEALAVEIAGLIHEQRGEPMKRHEDVRCAVFYDLENGERLLLRSPGEVEIISRRPLSPQEREEAERLAKEDESS